MSRGMAAGLVVTSDITHATPAAFGAHVHSRKCGREVFRQYLDLGIEVLLGGGIAKNKPPCRLDHEKRKSLVARAESEGYTLVHTAKELAGAPSTGRLLGLFRDGGLTSMAERTADCVEPTLAEMTRKALRILEKDPEGFFLLVEGSQIDWANHDRDAETLISEILAFDDAVGTVLDWLAAEAGRWGETLVIVVSDHETGGVLLDYNWVETPADRDWEGSRPRETTLSEAGLRIVYGSKLNHPKGKASHTAADTIIWSNARACGRALDNTDLFAAMMEHLNGTLAPRPEAPM